MGIDERDVDLEAAQRVSEILNPTQYQTVMVRLEYEALVGGSEIVAVRMTLYTKCFFSLC